MREDTGVTHEQDTQANTINDVLYVIEHNSLYNEGDLIVLALVMKRSNDMRRRLEAKRIMQIKLKNTQNIIFFLHMLSLPAFCHLYEMFSSLYLHHLFEELL